MRDNNSAFKSTEYYEKIKCALPYYEQFYKQITDVVNTYYKNKPLDWLDVGCGTGKMAEIAFRETLIKKFVFCDHSSKMLDIAKNRFDFPNAEFIISKEAELLWLSYMQVGIVGIK